MCSFDAASGSPVEIACEGVFDLAKNPPDALTAGQVAKVASGSNIVAAAGTLGIGWIIENAGAGSTTVRVKLVPSVASKPTVLDAEAYPKHAHEPEHAGAKRY